MFTAHTRAVLVVYIAVVVVIVVRRQWFGYRVYWKNTSISICSIHTTVSIVNVHKHQQVSDWMCCVYNMLELRKRCKYSSVMFLKRGTLKCCQQIFIVFFSLELFIFNRYYFYRMCSCNAMINMLHRRIFLYKFFCLRLLLVLMKFLLKITMLLFRFSFCFILPK